MRNQSGLAVWAGAVLLGLAASSVDAAMTDLPAAADTFNYEFLSAMNLSTGGFGAVLAVGDTGIGHDLHTLVGFDLPPGLVAADVVQAALRLYVVDGTTLGLPFGNAAPTAAVDVRAFAADSAWDEATVAWSTEPAPTGGAIGAVTVDAIDQWISLDVTAPVHDWLDGAQANHGFLLDQQGIALAPSGDLVAVVLDSTAGANGPILRLTLVPEPVSIVWLTGGLMLFAARRRDRRGKPR